MIYSGKLRHKLIIQALQDVEDSDGSVQDSVTGAIIQQWVSIAEVWGAIEPLSVREFTAAQSEQSKITTRIVIRYRTGVDYAMRVFHEDAAQYYNIEGVLADKDSGLEYLTLACSTGLRYIEDPEPPPVEHSYLFKDDGSSFLYKDDGVSFLYK